LLGSSTAVRLVRIVEDLDGFADRMGRHDRVRLFGIAVNPGPAPFPVAGVEFAPRHLVAETDVDAIFGVDGLAAPVVFLDGSGLGDRRIRDRAGRGRPVCARMQFRARLQVKPQPPTAMISNRSEPRGPRCAAVRRANGRTGSNTLQTLGARSVVRAGRGLQTANSNCHKEKSRPKATFQFDPAMYRITFHEDIRPYLRMLRLGL